MFAPRGQTRVVVTLSLWTALLSSAGSACSRRDDLDGSRRELPGLPERPEAVERDTEGKSVAFDLIDNRVQAYAHRSGALVIEAGSSELYKFIDGGWRAPWKSGALDGRRVAFVDGLGGHLWIPVDSDPRGIGATGGDVTVVLRGRALAPKQLVSIFWDDLKLADQPWSEEWADYSVTVPESRVTRGEHKLRFYFRHLGTHKDIESAAAIERIAIGANAVDKPAVVATEVERGGKRMQSLRVDAPSRISFYTAVPDKEPHLVFAAAGTANVQITATSDAGSNALWEGKAASQWSDSEVGLDRYAGEFIRLDLLSDGAVDWGRPQILSDPEQAAAEAERVDHIVLWTVASLRADRVFGDRTPGALYKDAIEGLRFHGTRAEVAHTGYANAAMATGRRSFSAAIPEGVATLAERMHSAGFSTALVSGNGFVHDGAGFARGFEHYENAMRERRHHGGRALWKAARGFIKKRQQGKTFVVVSTAEPHLPYSCLSGEELGIPGASVVPARTAELSLAVASGRALNAADARAVRALYDACVAAAASAFGSAMEELRDLELLDRTAVIVVGDHGEAMLEHGLFGHGFGLHGEELSVPLIIAAPGLGSGDVQRDAAPQDIFSTVLALAGLPAELQAQGASVLDPPTPLPRPIYARRQDGSEESVSLGRFQLVAPIRGELELFDRESDPALSRNLAAERPIALRALRSTLGLSLATREQWSVQRWGFANQLRPAFSDENP